MTGYAGNEREGRRKLEKNVLRLKPLPAAPEGFKIFAVL